MKILVLNGPNLNMLVIREPEHYGKETYADLENKIKVNGKERYNIYSCSKVITCTAALKLYEKGLFSLEDRLSKYMPEFEEMNVISESGIKKAEKPILIKHLFEMTAGFSYKCSSPELKRVYAETEGRCPTREVMKYLAKEPLLFEPGDRWEYSLCHDVLAAFIEVISGEKFEKYVQKNIFEPLGMKDSTFMLPESELDTLAEQYRIENGENRNIGKEIFIYKLGSEYASGGAGCIEDFVTLFNRLPKVDAGLAASIFHFGEVDIKDLKAELALKNINVRI